MTESVDSKENNYQAHVKTFDHGTPEDIITWYTNLQDIVKDKLRKPAEAKFTLTEPSLVGNR